MRKHPADCKCFLCDLTRMSPRGTSADDAFLAAKLLNGGPEYQALEDHLLEAYSQASTGKGKERHGSTGAFFEDQVICSIGRMLGSVDFELGQAIKKISESKEILKRYGKERAKAELYGAMVYLVGACVLIDEAD